MYLDSPLSVTIKDEKRSAKSASSTLSKFLGSDLTSFSSPDVFRIASMRSMRCSMQESCSGRFILRDFFSIAGAKVHAVFDARQ